MVILFHDISTHTSIHLGVFENGVYSQTAIKQKGASW